MALGECWGSAWLFEALLGSLGLCTSSQKDWSCHQPSRRAGLEVPPVQSPPQQTSAGDALPGTDGGPGVAVKGATGLQARKLLEALQEAQEG